MSGRMSKLLVKLNTYDVIYDPRSAITSQALVDFVADFSDDLQTEVELEARKLLEKENMGKLTFFIDGGSNFRGIGLGIVLKSP